MNKIIERNEITFESIKYIDENGFEYWLARELMRALEYKRWDKFNNVVNNAKTACKKSNYIIEDHFSHLGKMIELAKGAKRKILDYKLSRYACYLVVQNADPKKESLYEEERLEIIRMIKDNKIKVDDLGNAKLPDKCKKVSTSGEVAVYQNDEDGKLIGFWVFRRGYLVLFN